ncbi:MAG: heme-binding protein [Gaiellaceae bacterium]
MTRGDACSAGQLLCDRCPERAAGAEATTRGVAPVVAVVDAEGELVYLWRPDAAQVASVGVATDKARTAAIYRRPSRDFEQQASGGRPSALHLARAAPLQGGMPIVENDYVIGAIGVSGASSADEDQELAEIGLAGASKGNGKATFFPRTVVEAGGGILLDAKRYKLDAGLREAPGAPELHESDVDVMHVIEGTATIVTGGELHESSIAGGTEQQLAEGDVLTIPSGVPHQFIDVSDPFRYFVVKVEA